MAVVVHSGSWQPSETQLQAGGSHAPVTGQGTPWDNTEIGQFLVWTTQAGGCSTIQYVMVGTQVSSAWHQLLWWKKRKVNTYLCNTHLILGPTLWYSRKYTISIASINNLTWYLVYNIEVVCPLFYSIVRSDEPIHNTVYIMDWCGLYIYMNSTNQKWYSFSRQGNKCTYRRRQVKYKSLIYIATRNPDLLIMQKTIKYGLLLGSQQYRQNPALSMELRIELYHKYELSHT